MALRFTTTADAAKDKGVTFLVYAPAGYGKTMLCATAPSPLIISAESGLLTLRRYNLPVVEITSLPDLEEAYNFVTTSPHAKAFETICLDSISEIAEVCLSAAKKAFKDPRQAYGDMNERMVYWLRRFRDIPDKHIYFSAKQDREKDDATGMMLYGPSMPGKQLTQGIAHFFDEVFALGVGKTPDGQQYRFLRTRADVQFQAKDRSGALDELEEPNLTNVINKIKNSQ